MNKNQIKIAPSLLSANFANLEQDLHQCEVGGADIIHLDVMDGHFVPNLTFGPIILQSIRGCTQLPISTHLMVTNPDSLIPEFAQLGSDYISFHVEAVPHIHRTISLIKSFGIKVGVALNPATPLEYAFVSAEFVDYILLMSVNPGFGGQDFINNFYKRASELKEFLEKENLKNVLIEVDGGVKIENARQIVQAGADILVSGSGIFKGNIVENIRKIRESIL
ncbi:MAG: ribulose-phosphate 3-epimerase [Chloroherpetonaceae bacterium]